MAAVTGVSSIRKQFRPLPDPRVVGRTRHRLIGSIVLAIAVRLPTAIMACQERLGLAKK